MAHTKVTKTHSQNTGVANTFSYSGSFDVFKATEVEVELDKVKLTYTATTINESASPREYTVDAAAKTVHIGGADLSSGSVVLQPVTDMGAPTPRATYAPGASITSEDLNNNQKQLMRKAMEYDQQKLSSRGGTMTGNLHFSKDIDLSFEGSTDNAYETTLTVTDPTADRTITLPNVSGTVITTGDTGTVTATILAANSVDSSELVDGSIDTSHISNSAVTTGKIAADAVTGAKIADDSIDSEHYVDGSIDNAHIADDTITAAKIYPGTLTITELGDNSVGSGELTTNSVTTAKITDGNVTTAKIAAAAITTAKIADDAITNAKIASDAVTSDSIGTGAVTGDGIQASAVSVTKIADNAVQTAKINDNAVTTAKINNDAVTTAKIPDDAITTAKITDANVTTAKIADDAVTIAKVGCEQTTISDSDSHLPTSGAVVDYVAAQIAPIGGLEVIADEDNFPSTQPASGVVISIADAGGVVFNGSGVSTTARTAGNGSDNVTINNAPSSLYGETLAAGVGMQVSSTGSSQTYNYHKILAKEADVKQLSDDINDFNSRYRVNAGEPGSNNDDGDLCWDTSADKMKVYDGTASAWKEVTSSGDFKYLVMVNPGTTNAATLDGSNYAFDLKETSTSGSAASITSAAQLIVSINGVIQKANTGTSRSGLDGFVMTDSDTINFCAGVPSGADVFIVQIGSATTPTTPADGTVTAAKITSGAVTLAKMASESVDEDNLYISNAGSNGQFLSKQSGNNGGLTWATPTDTNTNVLAGGTITGDVVFDNATNAGKDITWDMSDDALEFADSTKAVFGAGSDLSLYHDGTNTHIDNNTGHLFIRNNVDDDDGGNIYIQGKSQENSIICNDDGAVELYHDNTKKIETTAAGVTVTGTVIDAKGDVRKVYKNEQANAYTLVAGDSGKVVGAQNTITVPASVFADGDIVTVVNYTSGNITLTQGSGLTLYNSADASTGNKTLAQRGMATIWFPSGTTAYMSGTGIS